MTEHILAETSAVPLEKSSKRGGWGIQSLLLETADKAEDM